MPYVFQAVHNGLRNIFNFLHQLVSLALVAGIDGGYRFLRKGVYPFMGNIDCLKGIKVTTDLFAIIVIPFPESAGMVSREAAWIKRSVTNDSRPYLVDKQPMVIGGNGQHKDFAFFGLESSDRILKSLRKLVEIV